MPKLESVLSCNSSDASYKFDSHLSSIVLELCCKQEINLQTIALRGEPITLCKIFEHDWSSHILQKTLKKLLV